MATGPRPGIGKERSQEWSQIRILRGQSRTIRWHSMPGSGRRRRRTGWRVRPSEVDRFIRDLEGKEVVAA